MCNDPNSFILPVRVKMTRILIADPDARTRQALTLLLDRRLGAVHIAEAGDRTSLERQLAANDPDLLLLDRDLPDLSPAEVKSFVGRSAGMRLILMSVDADDVATAAALDAAFIYKGAVPDEVLATLKALIPA
jgi:DNA-binding response OmpR family regulator